MRVLDNVLQWEITLGTQLGIDVGSETGGYRLTVGGYSGNADRY